MTGLPDPPAMVEATGPPDASEALATVTRLLAAAGLSPSAGEVAALAGTYPHDRASVDALYAIPEARYCAPALIFDPVPTFVDWWLKTP